MSVHNLYTYQSRQSGKPLSEEYEIRVFAPSWKRLFLSLSNRSGLKEDYHNFWVELRWAVVSFFQYQIYYVEKNGRVVHTSYCTPKSFKFPFMKKGDYHIGPCHTAETERGKGLYPAVLEKIAENKQTEKNRLYMIVEQSNVSSAAGVVKAGFVKASSLTRTKYLKRYHIVEANK